MKTTENNVLYFDEQTYKNSINELNIMVSNAKYLAEQWDIAGNLPRLNSELFKNWVNKPNLIYELYEKIVNEQLEKTFWKGASQQKKNNEMFELKLPDAGKVNRILEGLRSPIFMQQDVFCDLNLISFKDGKPYLSEGAKKVIKQKCSVEATEETKKLFSDLEAFCSNYNSLIAYIESKLNRKIHLSDFRGFKIVDGRLNPDAQALVRELYFKTDSMYRYGISPYVGGSDSKAAKKPRIPDGFKLNSDE